MLRDLLVAALKQAFLMFRPDIQWKNPVMFVVEVGAVSDAALHYRGLFRVREPGALDLIWLPWMSGLFLTVWFANFASALAEARGKAQADALRKTRRETPASRLRDNGEIEETVSTDLKPATGWWSSPARPFPATARSLKA